MIEVPDGAEAMMFRKAGIGLLLALLTTTALAAGKSVIPKQAEMSMLVTGTVRVELDGSVSGWEIDQREKLPDFVVSLLEKSAPVWRFEPVLVDGRPRKAEARMSLRVVANPVEGGAYRVAIRSAYFGEQAMSQERSAQGATHGITAIRKDPPHYPIDAARTGAEGTVYLILKLGRSGAVEDVAVERIDLKTIGTERQIQWMRETLRKPSMIAARKWTFRVPTAGENADKAYWSVRVPVKYSLPNADGTSDEVQYGQWEVLIPGPQQNIPWIAEQAGAGDSPEALVAGQVYEVGKGLKLLTPLQG